MLDFSFLSGIWLYITGVLGIQSVTIYVLSSKLDFIVNISGYGNV